MIIGGEALRDLKWSLSTIRTPSHRYLRILPYMVSFAFTDAFYNSTASTASAAFLPRVALIWTR
jgi:hypothetical protein